ncbi:MAG: hypothetical protein JST05_05610 [Acidobacteria bacterium]|nr:hypothetical protein [Acidobacteriota bacterium]
MGMRAAAFALCCLLPAVLSAQDLPLGQMAPSDRAQVEDIVARANFAFRSRTEPKRVHPATMEKLFDHPRMSVAMWRQCQFVPAFFASELSSRHWKLVDPTGLRADLRLVYARPGWRVYLVDGTAEAHRLGTPFSVSARMVASYRYWEGGKGFESEIQTWTALDSALLGFFARPFYGAIEARQDKFIAYINGNIASFGEAAELAPGDLLDRLRQEGDAAALRDFEALFGAR